MNTTPTSKTVMETLIPISENLNLEIEPGDSISDLLTGGGFNLIDFIFLIAGLVFFFNIIIAGWEYLFSGGDIQKATSAGNRILNSFFGIIIVAASFLIVRLISSMIGLEDII